MQKTILMIGAFDTKGEEYAFLRDQILAREHSVLTLNTGVMAGTDLFSVDIEADEVARAAGSDLAMLRGLGDRGQAVRQMAEGAAVVTRRLFEEGRIHGVVGMGGSGGSSVVTAAMRTLPVGVPKVCVSTVAGGNTEAYVGTKDVTLIPSITDVAGVNRISRRIFVQAAGAICGMVQAEVPQVADERPIIAASMFGNTTTCVDHCRQLLTGAHYEVLVFHATGTGGRAMESLIDEGLVDACLDITTTEWADTICGGIMDAGEDRLSAAGRRGIPHLIVPGCIDMVNFGGLDTVPPQYRKADRLFYEWNPTTTLMRTNVAENQRLGEVFARKANEARGPVAILIPQRGYSILDGDGERFCDRDADQAFVASLRQHLQNHIQVVEVATNINDREFSDRAVEMLLKLIDKHGQGN